MKKWVLVDLSPGSVAVAHKWIQIRKYTADGKFDKYIARLVTKVRVILALVVKYNLLVKLMDVKSAYLNRALNEEIYMEQPEMFKKDNRMCLLDTFLYGG